MTCFACTTLYLLHTCNVTNFVFGYLQGNFVLDELIAWKSRATSEDGPLDDDRLEKYKEMKVELKKRMAKGL